MTTSPATPRSASRRRSRSARSTTPRCRRRSRSRTRRSATRSRPRPASAPDARADAARRLRGRDEASPPARSAGSSDQGIRRAVLHPRRVGSCPRLRRIGSRWNPGCPIGSSQGTIGVLDGARGRSSRVQEMLIVGRGGEGVVLASQILADAFARAGFWAQSFPEFKAERRGAPISAFLRWDERHRFTAVTRCAIATFSSSSLRRRRPPEVVPSVRPGGLVVLNRETRVSSHRCRSTSRAFPLRASRGTTASSRRRAGRWGTWPSSARA